MARKKNGISDCRYKLLKKLMGSSLSDTMIIKIIDPMSEQPDEAREQIAADLLEQFKGAETPEQIQKRAEEILAAR